MAQVVSSDQGVINVLKTWYSEQGVESLLFRNSPLLKKVKKERVGGKEYAFAAMAGRSASVSGNYNTAIALAAAESQQNIEFKVPPGQLFTVVNITAKEILASTKPKGAYDPVAAVKFHSATEGFRKTMAALLFGSGWGELGTVQTAAPQGATTMLVDNACAMKLAIGSNFQVTTTVDPSSTLAAGGPYVVTKISDATSTGSTVTFIPAVAPVAGFIQNAWVELDGSRDATPLPYVWTGLAAWLPAFYNRGAAGGGDLTAWNSYIGTSFYNVTRSTIQSALAGNFYLRNVGGNERYVDALYQGVRLVRRQGGEPDFIVVNDEDLMQIANELTGSGGQTQYFAYAQGPDKATAPEFVRGLQNAQFVFSTSWIQKIFDDPYCPKGTAYILTDSAVRLLTLSNAETPINDGVAPEQPGRQKVTGTGDSPAQAPYQLNLDDYLNVVQGSATANGPATQISLMFFGNLAVTNPASCAVVKFA